MKGFLAVLVSLFFLAGCAGQMEDSSGGKEIRVQVLNPGDGVLLGELDEETTEDLFLGLTDWEETEPQSQGQEEYELVFLQEKTLLLGEDPEGEREYEEIARLTFYRDSDAVQWVISSQAVKNLPLPEEGLSMGWRKAPREILDNIRELLEQPGTMPLSTKSMEN